MHQAPLTCTSLKLTRQTAILGHRQACKHSPGSDRITGTGSASQLVGLHLRNPSLMGYYSFNRPRRDGWLSWPCWLTDSGRFTHKVVTRPAISLAQDRESSPARSGVLTTILHHQLVMIIMWLVERSHTSSVCMIVGRIASFMSTSRAPLTPYTDSCLKIHTWVLIMQPVIQTACFYTALTF